MVDLGINIGNLQLKNPVMTASGTFGYGTEFSDFFDISALGGIIIKGTKSANNKTTNVTEGTTESVESSTNTTEEKQPETTPSGNTTTTETNTAPTTESKE